MKLLLSSQGLITEELIAGFRAFSGGRRSVLIVTTAAQRYKERNRNNVKLKRTLDQLGFAAGFIDIACENPKRLIEAEILILNGGNPYYLLYHVRRTECDRLIKQLILDGLPCQGISAGLLVLMRNLDIMDVLDPKLNTLPLADTNGINLISDIIVPHYDRFVKEGKINKAQVDRFASAASQPVILLGEYQYLTYTDGRRELHGERIA